MTDLSTLKKDLKEKRYKDLAKWIIQFQKFKTDKALLSAPPDITKSVLSVSLSAGIYYLQTGEKTSTLSKKVYEYIDEYVSTHTVVPLTPSKENKRVTYNKPRQRKAKRLPINKVLDTLKTEASEQGDFHWAVKMGDTIKVFDDKSKAEGFLKGIHYLSTISGKDTEGILCQVEVKEI